jgi:carbonic anhydrase
MKIIALFAAAVATALAAPFVSADGAEGHAWGYLSTNASVATPSQWATYYPTCGGTRQSPIDITTSVKDLGKSPLSFKGTCTDYTLTQSHEAYKGSVVGGTCTASSASATYNLLQFHVHAPSEHTINGKAMDGEAHFVHSNADGSALLVVGLFFQASANAKTDVFFTDLLAGIDSVTEATSVSLKLYVLVSVYSVRCCVVV